MLRLQLEGSHQVEEIVEGTAAMTPMTSDGIPSGTSPTELVGSDSGCIQSGRHE